MKQGSCGTGVIKQRYKLCEYDDILVLLRQFHTVMSVETIVMHKSQQDNSVAKNALGRILLPHSLHHPGPDPAFLIGRGPN